MGGFTCSDIGQPHQMYLTWLCSRVWQQNPGGILGFLGNSYKWKMKASGSIILA